MSGTDLADLRREAARCTACDLYARATQTVFGEGPPDARLMLVGEQPGDREDRDGHPFVGPAGQLLDRALHDAGIDRDGVYITNAVKHFKWAPAGKVRLHKKPNAGEIRACSQWWKAELAAVQPDIVVLLGATAAQALLGPQVRVTRDHGRILTITTPETPALVTIHPSAILRMKNADRDEGFAGLVRDLVTAAEHVGAHRGAR
jgi:uracil-DNA glycosylase family protein